MTEKLKIIHIAPHVQAGGGIETLLGHYAKMPFDHTWIALFDRNPTPRDNYVNLDYRWSTTLGSMRRRFRQVMAERPGALVLWHNGWGFSLLAPEDQAARRLLFLYADPAYHAGDLPAFRGALDGVAGIVPALEEFWRRGLPELTPERGAMIGVPIAAMPERKGQFPGQPLILGYAGRVERAQKRLDRLAPFLRALEASGLDFRFEILGDGSFRSKLQSEVGAKVKFHGWVPRDEFVRVMSRWDAAVYFSDHEGGPIGVLEAMACGAIPFYPAHGGSWGDVHAPRVDPICYYPKGDVAAAAAAVAEIFRRPHAELLKLSARARDLVKIHEANNHEAEAAEFIRRIAALPGIAQAPRARRHWADALPLGFVTRCAPWLLRG